MFIQGGQSIDANIFSPISIEKAEGKVNKSVSMGAGARLMDYYVTEYPRRIHKEGDSGIGFVYTLFDNRLPAFAPNQGAIVEVGNALFKEAVPLTSFEEQIISETLIRTAKKQATRPNRK